MITAVAPSPSVDVTYVVPGWREGHVNRPTGVHRVAGGKGLNVARAAHRLGADVTAVAVLGGTGGAWVAAELSAIGLRLCDVRVAGPTRSCVSIADDGRHTMSEIYEPASPVSSEEWSAFEAAVARNAAGRPGWLTISGSLPAGAPLGAVSRLVSTGRAHGCAVAVDVHGAPLLEALDAGTGPDLVKVNVAEAADVLTADPATPPGELADRLARRSRIGAVVTSGVHGTWAVTQSGARRQVTSSLHGAYPVGSGDCLLAGLVVALDAGRDLLDAVWTATAVATANALRPGPAVFDDEDVRAAEATLAVR